MHNNNGGGYVLILLCYVEFAFCVSVSVTLFFLLVIIILIFVFRSRFEGGDYETEEATGAEFADDPDTAIVYNQTGLPNMTTKYEFFMWYWITLGNLGPSIIL